MQNSKRVHKRLTVAQRGKILSAYGRSQLPQRAFAAQAGVGLSTLQLWLRKAAAVPAKGSPAFVQVPNLLAQPSSAAVYRLHLAGGVILEMSPGFRAEELAVLLRLLPAL